MSRSPIQVPDEVKDRLEKMKNKFYAKSLHELMDRLMNYYEDNEKKKVIDKEAREKELQRQQAEMIQLGAESKAKFNEVKRDLKLRHDVSVFEFLREHYQNSLEINSMTFLYYRELERGENVE